MAVSRRAEPFRLTGPEDQRLTAGGGLLRRFHLDELPQVWNVLRGDMSLIGPRPVPLELYRTYCDEIPNYDHRHAVRPGITGLAQVSLDYTRDLEGERRKLRLDLAYVRSASWRLDGRILRASIRQEYESIPVTWTRWPATRFPPRFKRVARDRQRV
jgi:lipopolysaccharide/colanic/teichoic acid biosynthesis glycosyltransferase